MSSARWIEIGDCAIIKTEDLIQLEEKPRHAKKANRWVNRGGKGGSAVFILVLALISKRKGEDRSNTFVLIPRERLTFLYR